MTYRPLFVEADPGLCGMRLRPRLDWIELQSIVVDERYQRPVSAPGMRKVRRIAENFDWARFTPVLAVSLEDGAFALIDGQHRTMGAALAGETHIPAMIVSAETAMQADAFGWVNTTSTPVSPQQVYKAALAAGHDWAIRAHRAVEAAGCELMTHGNTAAARPGQLFCVKLIRRHVESDHDAAITDALGAIRDADEGGQVRLYGGVVVGAWIDCVLRRRDLDRTQLTAFTRRQDLMDIVDRAETLLKQPSYAKQTKPGLLRASFEAYLAQMYERPRSAT